MKTVWNVLSDNDIMDYPCIQTFASEKDAMNMVQELFKVYCEDNEIDPLRPVSSEWGATAEDIANGKYYRFTGGDYDEWVYVMESEITPSTLGYPVLDKDVL